MRGLSLPERLLTCPERTRAYVVKMKTWGNPNHRQRGCKGHVIAFPQLNAAGGELFTLPRSTKDLPDYLHVVFVGSKPPTEKQLAKVFKVDSHDVHTCLLEWKENGHPGYDRASWNTDSLKEMRDHTSTMEALRGCFSTTSTKNDEVAATNTTALADDDSALALEDDGNAHGKYDVDEHDGDYDFDDDDADILMDSAGMINVSGACEDTQPAVTRAINQILVTHGKEPVSTWSNPAYWVNTFPGLFPFGSGGAEKERPVPLSLQEWIRHMLSFHDGRFRKDSSFPYICFSILQTRERVTLSRVLYEKCYSAKQTAEINAPTSATFGTVLNHLDKTKTLRGGGQHADDIQKLLKHCKVLSTLSFLLLVSLGYSLIF